MGHLRSYPVGVFLALVAISVTLNFVLGFLLYTKISADGSANKTEKSPPTRSNTVMSRGFASIRRYLSRMVSRDEVDTADDKEGEKDLQHSAASIEEQLERQKT